MYPSLSVPTTLKRTGWVSEIPRPALSCWKPLWWFPQCLALWLLLIVGRVSQPAESSCFTEPLLVMWLGCWQWLITDQFSKEAVINPERVGSYIWSPEGGVSCAAISLRGVHFKSKINKTLFHLNCYCNGYSEYQKSKTILNYQWTYSSAHFKNPELSGHIEKLTIGREIQCD